MEYIRKDKNGEDARILIKILKTNYCDYVGCDIYQTKTVKRWFKLRVVTSISYSEEMNIRDTRNWNCEDFEKWADKVLQAYNETLIRRENIARVKSLIKNGCK